jgi:hypothetical protein
MKQERQKPFYCSDRLELDENERCVTQCDHCRLLSTETNKQIKLEDIFNHEKRRGVRDLIDAHKQETLEEASWKFNPLKKLDGEFLRSAFVKGGNFASEQIYNQIKELHDNEHITGFSKRAYAQCLDIIEQFKNK